MRSWVTEVAAEEILVVPLLGRERALGALALDNRRGGKRFTADDQTLLEGVASQAAISIENARVVEELRSSRDSIGRSPGRETLGALAAALAHEIHNPLVSIQTFLQLAPARRSEPDPDFWRDHHALACSELERIRSLLATLQGLASGAEAPAQGELLALLQVAMQSAAKRSPKASPADPTLDPPASDC
jgi:GAF domain-containing protein